MAITYTWQILHFFTADLEDKKDAVVEIFWRKIGTDENGNIGSYEGQTRFDPAVLEKSKLAFSDFSKLKEKTVLKWIESNINENIMFNIDESIQNKINRAKYNIKTADLPWNKG
jgi:hypothetical protein